MIQNQMPNTAETRAFLGLTQDSETVFMITLGTAFVLNFVLSGQELWYVQMVRSLQIVLHFALFQIKCPANVMTLFKILIPVVMFDILEAFEPLGKVFSFDDKEQDQ
jgi:hypothetical protein